MGIAMPASCAVVVVFAALELRGWPAAAVQSPPVAPAVRHARLFVYTSQNIRPRHREVVRRALERRVLAHSSGFRAKRREPVLELGGVASKAFHWKRRRSRATGELEWIKGTSAVATWPFAAVLEYSGEGDPSARIDWFRRARNSVDGGAWTKDPADQRYADHISAATVCHHDERYCYMAVVDTPTGGVIDGNEWVVRGRVQWKNAERARVLGWWVRFDTPGREPGWFAEAVPLVRWQPRTTPGSKRDFAASEPLREGRLAVAGTRTVFTLPAVPDTDPCRGR